MEEEDPITETVNDVTKGCFGMLILCVFGMLATVTGAVILAKIVLS